MKIDRLLDIVVSAIGCWLLAAGLLHDDQRLLTFGISLLFGYWFFSALIWLMRHGDG